MAPQEPAPVFTMKTRGSNCGRSASLSSDDDEGAGPLRPHLPAGMSTAQADSIKRNGALGPRHRRMAALKIACDKLGPVLGAALRELAERRKKATATKSARKVSGGEEPKPVEDRPRKFGELGGAQAPRGVRQTKWSKRTQEPPQMLGYWGPKNVRSKRKKEPPRDIERDRRVAVIEGLEGQGATARAIEETDT